MDKLDSTETPAFFLASDEGDSSDCDMPEFGNMEVVSSTYYFEQLVEFFIFFLAHDSPEFHQSFPNLFFLITLSA